MPFTWVWKKAVLPGIPGVTEIAAEYLPFRYELVNTVEVETADWIHVEKMLQVVQRHSAITL